MRSVGGLSPELTVNNSCPPFLPLVGGDCQLRGCSCAVYFGFHLVRAVARNACLLLVGGGRRRFVLRSCMIPQVDSSPAELYMSV